jgi:hypothetical protein
MTNREKIIARVCFRVASVIFFFQTAFGCIAFLGIGYDSLYSIILDLSLILAFPIYLISYSSRKVAMVWLWVFYVAQTLVEGPINSLQELHFHLIDFHDNSLLLGIILFTYGWWLADDAPLTKP